MFLCHDRGAPLAGPGALLARVKSVTVADSHPHGLAGTQIHRHRPARIDAPVWDIALEDVAAIGALVETGYVADTRLVSIAGPALREARLVRSQPGADLFPDAPPLTDLRLPLAPARSLVEGRGTGFLFEPGSKDDLKRALIEAHERRGDLAGMGVEARQLIEREHSWQVRSAAMIDELQRQFGRDEPARPVPAPRPTTGMASS